jgi:hypothetical protein
VRATRVAPDIAEAYDVPTGQLSQQPNSRISVTSKVTVDLGALVGRPDRETAVVLWELLLDPRQIASRQGEYTLGEVSVIYAATQHNNQMEQLQREVTVNVSDTHSAGAPIESDVKLALQLATAYRCQVQADSLMHDGNTEEALSQLTTASLRLQNAGDADLAIKAQQTAQKLATGSGQGGVDDMLQVRYQTKNLGLFHRLRLRRS